VDKGIWGVRGRKGGLCASELCGGGGRGGTDQANESRAWGGPGNGKRIIHQKSQNRFKGLEGNFQKGIGT